MWAYEVIFYQIYPLGFCGAPFENDGVLTHRIQKVNDWFLIFKSLAQTPYIFHRSLNRTPTATIPEITQRSTQDLAPTRILRKCVTTSTPPASKSS